MVASGTRTAISYCYGVRKFAVHSRYGARVREVAKKPKRHGAGRQALQRPAAAKGRPLVWQRESRAQAPMPLFRILSSN